MKVLFVGHDATRTGAPVQLLNLLRWFKQHSSLPFDILLKDGGVLEPEYARIAWHKVLNVNTARLAFLRRYLQRRDLLASYRKAGISLIYSNTLTNGAVLEYLSPLQCPVITHVHELENYIRSCGEENFAQIKRYTTLFIVPSRAVQQNLADNHGISQERMRLIPEFIPAVKLNEQRPAISRIALRQQSGIPEDAFVAGAVGTLDWRKSPDLFIQLAATVARENPTTPLHFVWVGGKPSWELSYDMEKAGLRSISFVPATHSLTDYYDCFDAFVLTSRVDPCPLVCLEAAVRGKPVICFDRAGGMPEFVEDDCGFVVPYLGIREMAEKIILLHDDRDLCRRLGERGRQKVRQRHDVEIAGRQIVELITECVEKGPNRRHD